MWIVRARDCGAKLVTATYWDETVEMEAVISDAKSRTRDREGREREKIAIANLSPLHSSSFFVTISIPDRFMADFVPAKYSALNEASPRAVSITILWTERDDFEAI